VAGWRVASAEALPAWRLKIKFIDGTEGEVHLQSFLESAQVRGTIFEALRDREMFDQVRVALGAVAWPNGADLAPDAMYDAIRARGCWVVEP
jgi:hypothetical protein